MGQIFTNLDRRNYSKVPPYLKQTPKWRLPLQSFSSSLNFDAFLLEKWFTCLRSRILCLAGVTDDVDLLTQRLFPTPSFLAPFTVEAGEALRCFPTHIPSFPGIWTGMGMGAVLLMGVQGSHGTASGKVIFFLKNGRNKPITNPSFFLLDVDMMLVGTAAMLSSNKKC